MSNIFKALLFKEGRERESLARQKCNVLLPPTPTQPSPAPKPLEKGAWVGWGRPLGRVEVLRLLGAAGEISRGRDAVVVVVGWGGSIFPVDIWCHK